MEMQFRGDDGALLAYDSVLTVASSIPWDDLTANSVSAVHPDNLIIKEAIKDNIHNVTILGASVS